MPPEGLVCKQCGHCCLNIGGHQTCATEEDITLWEENERDGLLEWVVEIVPGVYDIWMYPEIGDYVNRLSLAAQTATGGKVYLPDTDTEARDLQGLSCVDGACRKERMPGVQVMRLVSFTSGGCVGNDFSLVDR